MTKAKQFLSVCMVSICVVSAAAGILLLPSSAAQGAKTGLSFCAGILIPSLFPFMVLSSFVVKSGLAARLSVLLNPITRRLFRLPGCTGATIVIGMIGGYPCGARGVKALVEQGEITPSQGERMLSFTVGAGPAFVISVVGAGLLGSGAAGVILFLSQATASIVIGILSGMLSKESAAPHRQKTKTPPAVDLSNALVESTSDSTSGMLNMCAFVILFSSILTMMKDSGFTTLITQSLMHLGVSESAATSLLSILLEVTGGCTEAAKAGASPALISFALGWAGACVHFQIAASLNGIHFSRLKFTLYRFLHGMIAAVLASITFHFFPQTSEVFSTTAHGVQPMFAADFAGSFMLLVVCAMFLITLSAKNIDFPRKKC